MFPMGGASRFRHQDGGRAFALPHWYMVSATATRMAKQPMIEACRNGFEDRRSRSLTSTHFRQCRQIRRYRPSLSTNVQERLSLNVVRMP